MENLTIPMVFEALLKEIKKRGVVDEVVISACMDVMEVGIYTNRGVAFPIRLYQGQPTTFHDLIEQNPDMSLEDYIAHVYEHVFNRSKDQPRMEFPARNTIAAARDLNLKYFQGYGHNPNISKRQYVHFVRYMFATGQTCKKCRVGLIETEIDSYQETHSCLNCGNYEVVR